MYALVIYRSRWGKYFFKRAISDISHCLDVTDWKSTFFEFYAISREPKYISTSTSLEWDIKNASGNKIKKYKNYNGHFYFYENIIYMVSLFHSIFFQVYEIQKKRTNEKKRNNNLASGKSLV